MPDLADIAGIPQLWALTTGDPRVRVALVDGGPIELSHPCFDGAAIVEVADSWHDRGDDSTEEGRAGAEHGTWVASVLVGQHASPAPGLAPQCTCIIVPALSDEAHAVDPVNAARAIEAAVGAGANIIVLELCLPSRSGDVDGLLRAAVEHAEQHGVLVIAAVGNDSGNHSCSLASLPTVLAVGAHDDDGKVYGFTNWGPQYLPNAIIAPGGNMPGASIDDDSGVKRHKGTSCSAPIVAGVAALLASLQLARDDRIDPLAIRQALLDSALPCADADTDDQPARCLAGKLNVPGATRIVHDSAGSGAVVSAVASRTPGPVYALGTLGYDFGTEARRDTFKQLMAPVRLDGVAVPADPYDSRQMVDHLAAYPTEARSLIWTVNLELTPIYAVEPTGPFAAEVYQTLTRLMAGEVLAENDTDHIERISVPGRLTDRTVRLFSGQAIPVLEIEQTRGMYGWKINTLLDAAVGIVATRRNNVTENEVHRNLREFLTRVYYDLRNLGTASRDRALNFAATNVFQSVHTIADALAAEMSLDAIGVEKSPFCRMNSDCWDVRLRFFDPENGLRARKVFRFTIDVSDTLPVTVGDVRAWPEPKPPRISPSSTTGS
ncbi:PatA/PatG family cyanobactin maturation protease [Nocardia sp. NPDC050408]|uniref:PatA/PatG family cyanobactin maturation protease n=1 Tax=unclassified Nocardia TaxID=2637762 RepID=UPI0034374CA4